MLEVQQSMRPETEFTPAWRIPFWRTVYTSDENIDFMKNWILDNEEKLISQYNQNSRNDGGTGLGTNSLTAQYNSFNLFKETENIPEFQDFYQFLRIQYNLFMREAQAQTRNCVMYAWANVLRPGQSVAKHYHGASHYSYLSGNMHFDNYETITRYYNPFNEQYYDCPNQKGGITFFLSYIFHEATEFKQEGKRVSMAFDLFDVNHLDFLDGNYVNF